MRMDEDLKNSKSVEALIEDIAGLVTSQGTNEVYVRYLITAVKKFGCIFIKLTNRVERLTRWLIALTVVLCLIAFLQIVLPFLQLCFHH